MHELENIIWQSILHDAKKLTQCTEKAGLYHADVAPFAGMEEYNTENFKVLHSMVTDPRSLVFITGQEINIPDIWYVKMNMTIDQMLFSGRQSSFEFDNEHIIPLNETHVPQMLALTKQTVPGPFFRNTILFGQYHGIFDGDRLVSMAGLRLSTLQYKEISAVCTHPDYLGKGFATLLIRHMISLILQDRHIPFLHVRSDNAGAIRVYEKLGFTFRKNMYLNTVSRKEISKALSV